MLHFLQTFSWLTLIANRSDAQSFIICGGVISAESAPHIQATLFVWPADIFAENLKRCPVGPLQSPVHKELRGIPRAAPSRFAV